jgi:hypothetical protein
LQGYSKGIAAGNPLVINIFMNSPPAFHLSGSISLFKEKERGDDSLQLVNMLNYSNWLV